jgi:hypothetical protein
LKQIANAEKAVRLKKKADKLGLVIPGSKEFFSGVSRDIWVPPALRKAGLIRPS